MKSDVHLAVAGFNYGKFKRPRTQDEKLKYAIEAYANRDIPDYLRAMQQSIEKEESEAPKLIQRFGSISTVSLWTKRRRRLRWRSPFIQICSGNSLTVESR